jgi:hypothetical protein
MSGVSGKILADINYTSGKINDFKYKDVVAAIAFCHMFPTFRVSGFSAV